MKTEKAMDILTAVAAIIAAVYLGVSCVRVSLTSITSMWVLAAAFGLLAGVGINELVKTIKDTSK